MIRHIPFYLLALVSLVACGNRGTKSHSDSSLREKDSSEYLTEKVVIKIDSLSSELGRMEEIPMFESLRKGSISLTEKEKMVKPTYLLPLSYLPELHTLTQKHRAIAIYGVDMLVANLYEMPYKSDYRQTLAKLLLEVDNEPLTEFFNDHLDEDTLSLQTYFTKIYDAEMANGTINFFWDMVTSSLVECLYVTTQNIPKFIVCFDDRTASHITKRISDCRAAVEELIPYHAEMKNLYFILEPLYQLQASNVAQLTSELYRLKGDIERVRNELIKGR